MIIVNELAGIPNISPLFKHMPADADAMSFADVVFPAFLFIVGLSIPFSLNHRIAQGENRITLNRHIAVRATALIIMGVFMVNAETGFHAPSMLISIQSWALLSYLAFALTWGIYHFKQKQFNQIMAGTGILLLLILALIYQGGEDGSQGMSAQWWGILGLIGWSYLFSCITYQICNGKQIALLSAAALCIVFYITLQNNTVATYLRSSSFLWFIASLDGHAAHTSVVLLGITTGLIFFEKECSLSPARRYLRALTLLLSLVFTATLLRPEFKISKIYATPSWCLYSAAICIAIFSLLYWLIDLQKRQRWTRAFQPAAINPLVCYLLPFVIEVSLKLSGFQSPLHNVEGTLGILVTMIYASFILWLVHRLNKINFKIKF